MLFVDLAAQCAPTVPVALLAAIISLESQFEPLALRIDGQLGRALSAGEGVAAVVGHGDDGVPVAVGLAGLPEAALNAAKVRVVDGFDACRNLQAAAARLDGLTASADIRGLGPEATERRVLAAYFVASSHRGWTAFGYARAVKQEQARLTPLLASLQVGRQVGVATAVIAAAATGEQRAERIAPGAAGRTVSDPGGTRPTWWVFGASPDASVVVFDTTKQRKTK